LGVVLAGPASITTVTAKAPPEPVCGVCTSSLDEAAREHGVTLERGTSSMTIQLDERGTATFVARVSLREGADRLRNETLRAAIVRDVSYIVVEERQDLQTAIRGKTLIVRYRSDGVAHVTVGVLRFDAFQIRGAPPLASGGEGSPYPGADRVTLRARAGFRLHGSHGDISTETAIVWHGNSHEQYAGSIDEVVISFVPEDAAFPTLRVAIADVLDWLFSLGS
ncbi:MAG: hypothetical protein ABEI31_06185, partial [Halodesulfurarchaeum sp.]